MVKGDPHGHEALPSSIVGGVMGYPKLVSLRASQETPDSRVEEAALTPPL